MNNSPNNYLHQTPQLKSNQSNEPDLKVLLFKYLKYWPVILISVFIGLVISYFFNRYSTPIYRVESKVIVVDDKPKLGSDLFEASGLFNNKSNVDNEIEILKSYSLAEEALKELNFNVLYFTEGIIARRQLYGSVPIFIDVDWTHPQLVGGKFKLEIIDNNSFILSVEDEGFVVYNPNDPFNKSVLKNLPKFEGAYKFGEVLQRDNFKFKIENFSGIVGEKIYFHFMDTQSLALQYQNQIMVTAINKQASILTLAIQSPVKKIGEDYLNKIMEMYLAKELKEKNKEAENTILFIQNQLSGITDSLTFFENRLEKYRSENRIFDLSQEGSKIFERLQDLEKEKSQTEMNLRVYETLENYLTNEQVDNIMAPSMVGAVDPLLNALVMNLTELQAEQIRLSANYSAETPALRQIASRIESTKRALRENVRSAIRNAEGILKDYDSRIRMIEREINSLPETERRLLGIQRQFTINENIYIYLLEKRAEAEISKASNMPKNQILDLAMSKSGPVSPKPQRNLMFGIMFGLIFPIGFITIRHFLNTKVEDPKDLEKQLNVPLIGVIGRNSSSDDLPVLNSPQSSVTESFRGLRADMSYLASNKDKITILFTSSVSGEGKTFASVNMASVYSLMGKKTIIVGLDLRKPKIAKDFGLTNDVGISTCLSINKPWREVVKSSGFDNLDVILSGPIPPNPAELLLQDYFKVIMEEIKNEYEVVVLDCPPVGLVSETKELFQYADVNFFVFRQGYSERADFAVLNNLLEKGGVKKVYAVFNDVQKESGYGYGYGYGYGEGYGYHEQQKKSWWRKLFKSSKNN
jgi:tyrosine-protein kinase Etk/Wzc